MNSILCSSLISFQCHQEFERLPDSTDWKRFEKYGKRVRRLRYHAPTAGGLDQSVFDTVATTRTRLDILPNMHTLSWHAPLSLSILFMHSGVKKFSVFLPIELTTASPRPYFQDLATRMPNLINLDFRSYVPMRDIESEMVELFEALPRIRKVTFPRYYLTTKIAEALSKLDQLGVIEFQYLAEQGAGNAEDINPFTPTLEEGAFPTLWDHSMAVRYDDAARFLNLPFSPANLTMLYIDSDIIESPTSIRNMLSVVAENCQLLKFIALVSLRNASSSAMIEEEFDPEMSITIDTIKPALKLPNLTTLELVHQYPLSFKQSDLELLASSWPSLETLLLNTEPVFLKESNLTLEALLPFAKHCPQITHLGIFVDATIDELTMPTVQFQSLKRLSMGVSVIDHDNPVALYLSQILPLGCKVDCGITWDEAKEVEHELSHTVQNRCDLWTKVSELLPVLTKLRMQERERTRLLEKELDDLRMRTRVINETTALGVTMDISTCVMI